MRKYILFFFLLSFGLASGQQSGEFSIHAGGAFSLLKYDLEKGKSAWGPGGHIGLGYRYYYSARWSLGTGAEYQTYGSELKSDAFEGASPAQDPEGDSFEFRYRGEGYREKQRSGYLAIPLNLQFETAAPGTSWYINLGAKLAFNLHGSGRIQLPSLSTSAYYPEWDVELKDPAFMGFGQWDNIRSSDREVPTKTAFLLSGETGVKRPGGWIRYIGVYADYGLNNILKTPGTSPAVGYVPDDPVNFTYRSLTAAVNGSGVPYAEKLMPLSLGLKIRIVPYLKKDSGKK